MSYLAELKEYIGWVVGDLKDLIEDLMLLIVHLLQPVIIVLLCTACVAIITALVVAVIWMPTIIFSVIAKPSWGDLFPLLRFQLIVILSTAPINAILAIKLLKFLKAKSRWTVSSSHQILNIAASIINNLTSKFRREKDPWDTMHIYVTLTLITTTGVVLITTICHTAMYLVSPVIFG